VSQALKEYLHVAGTNFSAQEYQEVKGVLSIVL
jgi:hypothetical protein